MEQAPVGRDSWRAFLEKLPPEPRPLDGPAGEAEVLALEARLGVTLPSDYRNFLLTADGCASGDLYRMYPVAEVDWARDRLEGMAEAWEDFDEEVALLGRCLAVGDDASNAFYLLDPTTATWTAVEWWTTPSEITEYPTFGALAVGLTGS